MQSNEKFKIYATEDNPAHRELLRVAFNRANVDISMSFFETAEGILAEMDAAKAEQKLPQWLPDLFLIDMILPGKSGIELVKALRANPAICDTPIVVLSSSAAHRDRDAAFESGADDYFTKPTSLGDLVSMVGHITADWHNAKMAEDKGPPERRFTAQPLFAPGPAKVMQRTLEKVTEVIVPGRAKRTL